MYCYYVSLVVWNLWCSYCRVYHLHYVVLIYIFTLYLSIAVITFISWVLFKFFGVDIVGKRWFNNVWAKCGVKTRGLVLPDTDLENTVINLIGTLKYSLEILTHFEALQRLNILKCSFLMKNVKKICQIFIFYSWGGTVDTS